MSYYPSWVYSPREDITRNNMQEYDATKKLFYKKCEELEPDFWHLNLRERQKVKAKVEKILGYFR